MKRHFFAAALIVLAACAPVTPSPAETRTGSPPTATFPAAATPTGTSTPEAPPTFVILPGLTPLQHPGFPGLVFLVDANRWVDDFKAGGSAAEQNSFLHYKSLPACRLEAVPDTKIPLPVQIDRAVMRGRVFHIYEYTGYDLYESRLVYFRLEGIVNPECRTVLETLLADVVDGSVFDGGPTATPYATGTPMPLAGFTCGALPPLLHPGDTAYLTTSGVWLRSSPELGPNNTLKLFPKHAPVLVAIQDGPVCASGYAYWQVTVTPIGGVGRPYRGWMAESNAQTYVLRNWNP